MLQDKGDRLPSCHAGVQGWTLQEVPARHCLLHIPGYPLSSSCEPPNLMQKGLSGGKGLRTRQGPPAPGQGSGSTGVGGSRDKGRDVLAGSSSHSWAMLGAGGGRTGHSPTGTPHWDTPGPLTRVQLQVQHLPPPHPKPIRGRAPLHWGHPQSIRHPKSSSPCIGVPHTSRIPNPAKAGGGGGGGGGTPCIRARRASGTPNSVLGSPVHQGAQAPGTPNPAPGCIVPRGAPCLGDPRTQQRGPPAHLSPGSSGRPVRRALRRARCRRRGGPGRPGAGG